MAKLVKTKVKETESTIKIKGEWTTPKVEDYFSITIGEDKLACSKDNYTDVVVTLRDYFYDCYVDKEVTLDHYLNSSAVDTITVTIRREKKKDLFSFSFTNDDFTVITIRLKKEELVKLYKMERDI